VAFDQVVICGSPVRDVYRQYAGVDRVRPLSFFELAAAVKPRRLHASRKTVGFFISPTTREMDVLVICNNVDRLDRRLRFLLAPCTAGIRLQDETDKVSDTLYLLGYLSTKVCLDPPFKHAIQESLVSHSA